MKYFSDKGLANMPIDMTSEFTTDFFEFENAFGKTELAGGTISQKIIETHHQLIKKKNMPH